MVFVLFFMVRIFRLQISDWGWGAISDFPGVEQIKIGFDLVSKKKVERSSFKEEGRVVFSVYTTMQELNPNKMRVYFATNYLILK